MSAQVGISSLDAGDKHLLEKLSMLFRESGKKYYDTCVHLGKVDDPHVLDDIIAVLPIHVRESRKF